MRIKNIASGSSGNVTLVGNNNHHMLVDCGISCKRITDALKEEDMSVDDIDAILITHEHSDHVAGLSILEKKKPIKIYATKGTIKGMQAMKSLAGIDKGLYVPIESDVPFAIGDMEVCPYKIWHDANEPVCYKIKNTLESFAVVTDLGDYDDYLLERLKGLDGIMLEANHDIRMLEAGPYPYPLKRRILGKYGHLSNEGSGRLLAQLLHDNIKYIMLGHLSKENNTMDLAKLAVETEIALADNEYRPSDFDIHVARRDRPLDLVEI